MSKRCNEQVYEWCPDCGHDAVDCICDEDEWYELEANRCDCPYCHCFNRADAGLVCNDCLAGVHQG